MPRSVRSGVTPATDGQLNSRGRDARGSMHDFVSVATSGLSPHGRESSIVGCTPIEMETALWWAGRLFCVWRLPRCCLFLPSPMSRIGRLSHPTRRARPLRAASQCSSWPRPGMLAVVQYDLPVHDDEVNARAVLKWIGVRGAIRYRVRVEDRDVGEVARRQQATLPSNRLWPRSVTSSSARRPPDARVASP